MMKLLGLDIDGCLMEPNSKALSLEVLSNLRRLNQRAIYSADVPRVFFCSGRSHGFVEALMRVTDCRIPCAIENGTALVMPNDYRIESLVESSTARARGIGKLFEDCRRWVETQGSGRTVPGKVLTLSFYPAPGSTTTALAAQIRDQFARIDEHVEIFVGPTSLDMVPRGIDKSTGVRRIAEITATPLIDIGGIGDAANDIEWLKIIGKKGAPRNAEPAVKEIADTVAAAAGSEGVAEILDQWFPQIPTRSATS